jgi:endonuclease/exonuclease/phosphatase family metal-dependent hydrolase
VRVATYNIHKGIGGVDRRYRPERIAELLAAADADVLLLQEVDDGCVRSARHRQVDWLGDAIAYPHRAWAANVVVRGGGAYGNAILSRWPIASWSNLDLTIGRRKRRSALVALVEVPGALRLPVVCLHLGLAQAERERQVAMLLGAGELAALGPDTPAVVGGDLNDVYGRLAAHLEPGGFRTVPTPATFPAWGPLRALDGIYARGRARVRTIARGETPLDKRASDHRMLLAEIDL